MHQVTLTQDHFSELSELVTSIENHDKAPFRTLPSELLTYYDPGFDTRSIGFVDDGRLIGYGVARRPLTGGNIRCSGGIHPQHRGVGHGTHLVEWFENASAELAADNADLVMEIHVEEGREELSDLLLRRGFSVTEGYTQYRRDLSQQREDVSPPHFFDILSWEELADQAFAQNLIEAFGEQAELIKDRFFMPEWSFVLLDKRTDRWKLAGYIFSHKYEQDWDASGITEGYTELMAIEPEYRGLHFATMLLNRVADAYQADGIDYASVDIDIDDEGHAPLAPLFDSLGYEPIRTTNVFTRRVEKKLLRPLSHVLKDRKNNE